MSNSIFNRSDSKQRTDSSIISVESMSKIEVIIVTNPVTGGRRIFKDENEMYASIGRGITSLRESGEYHVVIGPIPEPKMSFT